MTNWEYFDSYADMSRGHSLRVAISRSIGENNYRALLSWFIDELQWQFDLQAIFLGALRYCHLEFLDDFSLEALIGDSKIQVVLLTSGGRSLSGCNRKEISHTVGEIGEYFRFNHCRKYFNEGLELVSILGGAATHGNLEFARYVLKSAPPSSEVYTTEAFAYVCGQALRHRHLHFMKWFLNVMPSFIIALQSPLKVLELLVAAHPAILLDLVAYLESLHVEVSKKFLYAIARDSCYEDVLRALEAKYGFLPQMPPLSLPQVQSMILRQKAEMLVYILQRTPHSPSHHDQFFRGLTEMYFRDAVVSADDFAKVARCLFDRGYRLKDEYIQSLLTEKFLADSKLAVLVLSNAAMSEGTMVKLILKVQKIDSTFADFIRSKAVT
jgi:hypothetical protein